MARRNATADDSAADVAASTDVAHIELSEDQLRGISTIDDALELLRSAGIDIARADEDLGDGFAYTEKKDVLVGRPLLLVKWECSLSSTFTRRNRETGKPEAIKCVQVWAIADMNGRAQKIRFTDFSSGICQQLWDYSSRTERNAGLMVPMGLRRSEYTFEDDEGNSGPAETFYLDIATPNA